MRNGVLVFVLLASCGGRVADEVAVSEPPSSADAGSGSEDVVPVAIVPAYVPPTADGPPPSPTCAELADAMCSEDSAACCAARGTPMDAAKCRARAHRECRAFDDAVVAGTRTLDLTALPACVARWRSMARACEVAKTELLTAAVECARVFPQTKTGSLYQKCSTDADCLPPMPDTAARCDSAKNCRWIPLPIPGISWNSRGGPIAHECFPGEALCLGSAAGGVTYRCGTELPLGATCGAKQPGCCAIGSYCSAYGMGPETGTCVPALAKDTSCGWSFMCRSYACDGRVCTDRSADDPQVRYTRVASEALCTGVGDYGLGYL
jgi:hypothetical protein